MKRTRSTSRYLTGAWLLAACLWLTPQQAQAQCTKQYGYYTTSPCNHNQVRNLGFCGALGGRVQSAEWDAANHRCRCTNAPGTPGCDWRDDEDILSRQLAALREIIRVDATDRKPTSVELRYDAYTRPEDQRLYLRCRSYDGVDAHIQTIETYCSGGSGGSGGGGGGGGERPAAPPEPPVAVPRSPVQVPLPPRAWAHLGKGETE